MKPSVQITPITRRALVSGAIASAALSALPAMALAYDQSVDRMKFGPEVRYIPQWQSFYVRHPELVAWERSRPRFRPSDWMRMERIARRQNHPYRSDGSHDVWRLLQPGEAGDCEDMVLTLMRDL